MFQFATIAMYTAHLRAPSGAVGVKPKKKAQSQENLLRGGNNQGSGNNQTTERLWIVFILVQSFSGFLSLAEWTITT